MAAFIRVGMALLAAHLLGDFVLQTRRIVEGKAARRFSAYFAHGLIHFILALFFLRLFAPQYGSGWLTLGIITLLVVVHLVIDYAKCRMTGVKSGGRAVYAFFVDQALHLLTLGFAAYLLAGARVAEIEASASGWLQPRADKLLLVAVIYLGVIFGLGYPIGMLTDLMVRGRKRSVITSSDTDENGPHVGLYIGWLERFLVLTAMMLASPAAVALILTAKSIARYPKFTDTHFAETFLVGTLLSLSAAILGGIFLLRMFHGSLVLNAT